MDDAIEAVEFLDDLLALRRAGLLERDEASDEDNPRFRPTEAGRAALEDKEARRAG